MKKNLLIALVVAVIYFGGSISLQFLKYTQNGEASLLHLPQEQPSEYKEISKIQDASSDAFPYRLNPDGTLTPNQP